MLDHSTLRLLQPVGAAVRRVNSPPVTAPQQASSTTGMAHAAKTYDASASGAQPRAKPRQPCAPGHSAHAPSTSSHCSPPVRDAVAALAAASSASAATPNP